MVHQKSLRALFCAPLHLFGKNETATEPEILPKMQVYFIPKSCSRPVFDTAVHECLITSAFWGLKYQILAINS